MTATSHNHLEVVLTCKIDRLHHVIVVLDPHNDIRGAIRLQAIPHECAFCRSKFRGRRRNHLAFYSTAQLFPIHAVSLHWPRGCRSCSVPAIVLLKGKLSTSIQRLVFSRKNSSQKKRRRQKHL